ncbi:MAG: Fpg/Nei family DNA glycosylase [bacterium]|nr:Fpg/Nei family DNA glycosylase [bacterium]
MPEGHTIHRAARLQRELIVGGAVRVESPQGRFSEAALDLDGAVLRGIEAYGKHLVYDFGDDRYVHVHLGLFGRFRMGRGEPPEARGAERVRFASECGWVSLGGPTACDLISDDERRRLLARLGPDPLRGDARPAPMIERIARSSAPIGTLLMDQSVVAGIGNVYRAELLFRARVHPATPGRSLEGDTVRGLWRDARTLLREGERSGRIVTTRPADRPHPRGGVRRGEQYYVYHRTACPCRLCETPIAAALQAARTVYWCPSCQRAGR